MELVNQKCEPCSGSESALTKEQYASLLSELDSSWSVVEGRQLEREFIFSDFASAMEFANFVGEMSEIEDHHPEITVSWGKVAIKIYTHVINGLSHSDFVWAAKCDRLFSEEEMGEQQVHMLKG